jgi:methanogenic corrinoid protein MtbC1
MDYKREIIMNRLETIIDLLRRGRAPEIKIETQAALDEGITAADILEDGLMAGMQIIGDLFKENKIFVPEMLIAARAMAASLAILNPHLVSGEVKKKGTAILGTVKGDLHDIGKNLVKIMMEGKGLVVIDLGVDVAPEKYAEAAKEHGAQIIACSALLTTTMTEMKRVVQAAVDAGIRDSVKIMIGGAPVTENYKNEIGADFYSADAATASDVAIQACLDMAV